TLGKEEAEPIATFVSPFATRRPVRQRTPPASARHTKASRPLLVPPRGVSQPARGNASTPAATTALRSGRLGLPESRPRRLPLCLPCRYGGWRLLPLAPSSAGPSRSVLAESAR